MEVVFLHGPPACGKLTIARELSRLLSIRLFHNHLTVDLAASLFDFGTPDFITLREAIWLTAFEAAAAAGHSFVFTFAPEATVNPTLIARLTEVITRHGGRIHFIKIQCGEATVEARLGARSRAEYGKLQDVALYRHLRKAGAFIFPPLPPPILVIDSETTEPAGAARLIAAAVAAAASAQQP